MQKIKQSFIVIHQINKAFANNSLSGKTLTGSSRFTMAGVTIKKCNLLVQVSNSAKAVSQKLLCPFLLTNFYTPEDLIVI